MKARVTVALVVALVLVTSANHLHGQKIKVIRRSGCAWAGYDRHAVDSDLSPVG